MYIDLNASCIEMEDCLQIEEARNGFLQKRKKCGLLKAAKLARLGRCHTMRQRAATEPRAAPHLVVSHMNL